MSLPLASCHIYRPLEGFGLGTWSAARSLRGMGLFAVFVHVTVGYPFEQRPALAAYFFALMGVLAAEE